MAGKKTERLFKLVNILRSGKGFYAAELAGTLGVSKRTIYRDVVELSGLVPIHYDRGYRLMPGAFVADADFTREELLAIRLGVKNRALAAASPYAAATQAALIKIDGRLSRRAAEGEDPTEKITVHVKAHPVGEKTVRMLCDLDEAVTSRRTVELEYFSLSRNQTTRRAVDPYGLTFRRHSWYLVGLCHGRKKPRVFRADRISAVKVTRERFEAPRDFSLDEFFADAWEVYVSAVKSRVKLLFDPRLGPVVRPELEGRGKFYEDGQRGGLVFEGEVPVSEEFRRWLLTFGEEVEVLEPASLRGEVATTLRAAAARYGPRGRGRERRNVKRRAS
jgi:predicted DNA-binding transcriptional regulator YafY